MKNYVTLAREIFASRYDFRGKVQANHMKIYMMEIIEYRIYCLMEIIERSLS